MIVEAVAGLAVGAIVTVVLDGRTIDASSPATLAGGVTVAPLAPFVRDIAERIDCLDDGRRLRLVRGGRDIVVHLAAPQCGDPSQAQACSIAACVRADDARIPLAAVARALGASVAYDARAHTVFIALDPAPIAALSAAPYVPPPPGSVPTFTPTPVPMPRPTVTGIPRPRRTPVLVESSPIPQ